MDTARGDNSNMRIGGKYFLKGFICPEIFSEVSFEYNGFVF